eukprot:TRINITY_DN70_c0_g1_i1.p1 TRINITY_DN70_c0_g1~~TRINITY_DN70_c0_g1_i1.p1  ORF type:complete len:181 (+),score=35.18 TRINITY_DN70_c0_g1_i1:204-746(+)
MMDSRIPSLNPFPQGELTSTSPSGSEASFSQDVSSLEYGSMAAFSQEIVSRCGVQDGDFFSQDPFSVCQSPNPEYGSMVSFSQDIVSRCAMPENESMAFAPQDTFSYNIQDDEYGSMASFSQDILSCKVLEDFWTPSSHALQTQKSLPRMNMAQWGLLFARILPQVLKAHLVLTLVSDSK